MVKQREELTVFPNNVSDNETQYTYTITTRFLENGDNDRVADRPRKQRDRVRFAILSRGHGCIILRGRELKSSLRE